MSQFQLHVSDIQSIPDAMERDGSFLPDRSITTARPRRTGSPKHVMLLLSFVRYRSIDLENGSAIHKPLMTRPSTINWREIMSSTWDLLDQWFRETAYKFCSWLTTAEGYLFLIIIITAVAGISALILASRRRRYPF